MDIGTFIRESVSRLTPYSTEEQACRIKLDANESPFRIDWAACQDIIAGLKNIEINRYPDSNASELKRALASYLGWPINKIILGNGSDELIQYIIMAFGGVEKVVYAPYPSFSMYKIIALSMGQEFREIPLVGRFELHIDSPLRNELADPQKKIVFIASPNNPSGNSFCRDDLLTIIKETNGIVCIDEAYQYFSDTESLVDILPENQNLIILRTLSKIGLAGLRIGILLGNDKVIEAIAKVRLPFNLDAFSQFIACSVLQQRSLIDNNINKVKKNRIWLEKGLKDIEGIEVFPSKANFILFSPHADARIVYRELMGQGILVRLFPPNGRWPGMLRVTVGTMAECEEFIQVLRGVLSKRGGSDV